MKKKNLLILLTFVLFTSIILAACGSQASSINDVTETEIPDNVGVDDVELVPIVIWTDALLAEVINSAAPEFEAEYGVDLVTKEFGWGAILGNFQVAAPVGEGPDIIVAPHDWLGELVSNGLLLSLDLGDKLQDFSSNAISAFTYEGELYGMPYMMENVALFRNSDLVPTAPATWDDVADISRSLAENNTDDIETNQYGFILQGNDAYHFYPLMTAYGGYVFGQTVDGMYDATDIGIDSPGTIEAAIFLDSMIEEGLIPSSVDGQMVLDWFLAGKAAMIITGPWNLPQIEASGIDLAIDPLPKGTTESRPFLGTAGFMVSSFSENQLLAQIVVTEFLGTSKLMRAFYDAQPRPSAYLPVANSIDDPSINALSVAGENAMPMPSIPEMGSVWQAWINAITLVTQQTSDPEKAFSMAGKQIDTSIEAKIVAEAASEAGPVEYELVNVSGTHQPILGCNAEWMPECKNSILAKSDDGLWKGTFDLPAGEYELKIACNGGWDTNFGFDGIPNGSNYRVTLSVNTTVTFSFDPETGILEIQGEGIEVSEGAGY